MQATDVLMMRAFYSRIGVWPAAPFVIDPEGWLSNFKEKRELEIAVALLDSFLFINEQQTMKMFETAFATLSAEDYVEGLPGAHLENKWAYFRSRVLVSFPTDDQDTASGSGYKFVRLARQKLGLSETQLFDPAQLVNHLSRQSSPMPVVLVDDIVGSGDQFLTTWDRPILTDWGNRSSLHEEVDRLQCPIFYTPAVCTQVGAEALESSAPQVRLRPAHFLPSVYSAKDPNTLLVPDEMRGELASFIIDQSRKIAVSSVRAFGWGELGLALAFDHSTPDLTLPIFTQEFPGWKPLVSRR